MTKLDIAAIRARAQAATPGPWRTSQWGGVETTDGKTSIFQAHDLALFEKADEDFVSHARTDVPALCDALEEAEARVKELEGEVEKLAAQVVDLDVDLEAWREDANDSVWRAQAAEAKVNALADALATNLVRAEKAEAMARDFETLLKDAEATRAKGFEQWKEMKAQLVLARDDALEEAAEAIAEACEYNPPSIVASCMEMIRAMKGAKR